MRNAPYVHRRTFLKATFGGAAATLGTSSVAAGEEHEVCVVFDEDAELTHTHSVMPTETTDGTEGEKIGEITGSGDPVGVDGEYVSDVYIAERDRFDFDLWRGVATVGPHSDGRGRIWLSEAFRTETARLLAHERGHNLGFEHTGGFMDPSDPDMDPEVELDEESVETVRHTDGLHIFDWSVDEASDHVFTLIEEWQEGNASSEDVFYAIGRWRDGDARDVYADNTFAEGMSEQLEEYDDEERRIRSNAIYRPENGDRFEPWG